MTFQSHLDATYTLVDDEKEYQHKAYGVDDEEPIESDDRPPGWPDGRD